MNLKIIIRNSVFLLLMVFISSCTSKKKLVYFNEAQAPASSEANKNYTPVFKSDDLLMINVMGMDAEAVKPFNLPVLLNNNVMNGYTNGNANPQGYLIDAEGNIDFPVLGKIKMAGLNRNEATELLKEKLKPYLKEVSILIRILNFKVTVLGEVRNPGSFNIPNERITLLEAIGIAGDLNITAVRKNILVIRDENGKKTEYRVDLTKKDVFGSPVFYLNQNDVVYVQPNRAKINSSVINPANAGIVISAVSLIVSVLVLLSR